MYHKPRIYPSSYNEDNRKRDADIPGKLDIIISDPDSVVNDKQFATSVKAFWDKNGYITDRQLNYVNVLINKKSYRSIDEEFCKNFSEEQRKTLRVVANYYNLIGQYYYDIARKVIVSPEWIPTKKQYEAMCCNKYAIAIMENYNSEPKYSGGDLVTVRDTYRGHTYQHGKCIMIISPTDIVGPAKGSRMYRVAEIGSATTEQIQEKDVKMYRR